MSQEITSESVAVIGVSLRFPEADDCSTFWNNLLNGVDSISRPPPNDAIAQGGAASVVYHPQHISAAGRLVDIGDFDAEFFGLTPQQAVTTDPQHRLMLELGHQAIEDAGYDSSRFSGRIGVFAGIGLNSYLWNVLLKRQDLLEAIGPDALMIGNDKGFSCTRLSYKLNLKGPSMCIDTACSTSLVAIHQACRSLLSYECDIALAGGVRLLIPHWDGDIYEEGGILAKDGVCRAFDKRAAGTVVGSGGALVALRRLDEAIEARDSIRAIVRGSAINNDGASKVSYSAPSVSGQAEVVSEALLVAAATPESIGYLEAHGTGTPLGDELELAALSEAFGPVPDELTRSCAIGTVKTNIGHLDVASGVAGFIKAALAVQHGIIPPSLNCEEPNEVFSGNAKRFFVSNVPRKWPSSMPLRRAGVSSFGIGGTNAHVVLEEPPPAAVSPLSNRWHTIVLSGRSPTVVAHMRRRLAERLRREPTVALGDVAFTLQTGRKAFDYRSVVVGSTIRDVLEALESELPAARRVGAGGQRLDLIMLFPGQGSQYPGMSSGFAKISATFRREFDACLSELETELRDNVIAVLSDRVRPDDPLLLDTSVMQPALFIFEYALAQMWISLGVEPTVLVGHSLGEYVAACLAGVFTLSDALRLVCARGSLMQRTMPGAMMAVELSEEEVIQYGIHECCLAAVNGPKSCVLAGAEEALDAVKLRLTELGFGFRKLRTSRAFHSRFMDPILAEFEKVVAAVPKFAPSRQILSSVDGKLFDAERVVSTEYWVRQLREPVRFDAVIEFLLGSKELVSLEVGPGGQLTSFARRTGVAAKQTVICTGSEPAAEERKFAEAVGDLFSAGIEIDWTALHSPSLPSRLPLPTYPFERKRYWPDSSHAPGLASMSPTETVKVAVDKLDLEVLKFWRETFGDQTQTMTTNFFDVGGDSLLATRLVSRLRDRFAVPISVQNLFAAPTPQSLAELIRQASAGGLMLGDSQRHVASVGPEIREIGTL